MQLMDLNAQRAMTMLRDNRDKLPVSVVVPQLEKYPKYEEEGGRGQIA